MSFRYSNYNSNIGCDGKIRTGVEPEPECEKNEIGVELEYGSFLISSKNKEYLFI